ncbi:hypothetical protein HIM_10802 [Hirsutella minnesotensis 3608]|uniref:FAR1 domain-containing protein n=1 Tax=Hirsutella minnesotensis 3608 TaxID=1043627 RepID=A0A0F7ZRL1_9HYPO|nr:hypothetical protein HIM_10802 [Hirsutella minnesotensis 3608]
MEAVYALQFESHQDAIAACHAAARAEGFALAVRTKKPSAANPRWILLRCSKGRHWQDQGDEGAHESKRRRKTSTQKTNCEFRIIVRKATSSASKSTHPGGWVVAPSSLGEAHNHEFTPAITHSRYRAEVIQRHHGHITHLYNCGLRPFLIASHLRGLSHEDPDLAGITGQHVRNAIASYRLQELTTGKKRKAGGKVGGKAAAATVNTAGSATDVTKRGLEYLQANGDLYEPGTAMPRAYQRAVCRTPDSDDELTGPGETQGTIRCATQQMMIPSIRQGGEDIEYEDDPLADFIEMDRQVDEEESVQRELCAEGLL